MDIFPEAFTAEAERELFEDYIKLIKEHISNVSADQLKDNLAKSLVCHFISLNFFFNFNFTLLLLFP